MEYPSLLQQGKNLSQFTWRLIHYLHQNAGNLHVSDSIFNERMSLCQSCEHFDQSQTRCTQCGCFLNVKAKMMFEECPVGKWGMDESVWNEQFENIVKMSENDEK